MFFLRAGAGNKHLKMIGEKQNPGNQDGHIL
jgi:hypothetical protein